MWRSAVSKIFVVMDFWIAPFGWYPDEEADGKGAAGVPARLAASSELPTRPRHRNRYDLRIGSTRARARRLSTVKRAPRSRSS